MFKSTQPINPLGNSNIYLVYIFSCQLMQDKFNTVINERKVALEESVLSVPKSCEKPNFINCTDLNAGAIYKITAYRKKEWPSKDISKYYWHPSITCGFTGILLWEDDERYLNHQDALAKANEYLQHSISLELN